MGWNVLSGWETTRRLEEKKKSLNPRQWEKSSSLTWRHIFLWYANFQTNSQQLKRWFMLAYRMYNFLCRKSKKPSFFAWCSIIIYIREKTIKEEEKNLNFHMPERQKDDCRCKKGWLVKRESCIISSLVKTLMPSNISPPNTKGILI